MINSSIPSLTICTLHPGATALTVKIPVTLGRLLCSHLSVPISFFIHSLFFPVQNLSDISELSLWFCSRLSALSHYLTFLSTVLPAVCVEFITNDLVDYSHLHRNHLHEDGEVGQVVAHADRVGKVTSGSQAAVVGPYAFLRAVKHTQKQTHVHYALHSCARTHTTLQV